MALTSGAKKFCVVVVVAALIAAVGIYVTKKKKLAIPTEPPAAIQQPISTPVVEPAKPAVPVVEEKPATEPKKHKVVKKVSSTPRVKHEVTHGQVEKELTSDQKALQGLAGDKL